MPSASRQSGGSFPRFFIAGLGLTFLVMNVVVFFQSLLLHRSGTPAQAVVTSTHLTRRRGGNAYNADYAFYVGGTRREGSGEVRANTYYNLRPGSPITIRYVPSNPAISETAEMSHNSTGLFLAGVLGFPTSLFILFMAFKKQPAAPEPAHDPAVEKALKVSLKMPSLIRRVAFTAYPVRDMARARRFYEEVLGLRAAEVLGQEWTEYQIWDNRFALSSNGSGIAFEVSDVDAFVDELRKKQVTIKSEPTTKSSCRMAVAEDSEGNTITFYKRIEG